MTFEEFKKLALNPPYIESECVYRVDIHRYSMNLDTAMSFDEFETTRTQSFMLQKLPSEQLVQRFVRRENFNHQLYAIYIYELPFKKDVSNDLYRRLGVYDRNGMLVSQSTCSALIEDLNTPSANFRGHDAESIRFKPGDIVEVYDRGQNKVRLAVVVDQPLTIEQCWETYKDVVTECVIEGVGAEFADDNYWLYACDDCYCVVYGPDLANDHSYPYTTDVFAPMCPVSDELRQRFAEYYRFAIENKNRKDEITTNDIRHLLDFLKNTQ